MRSSTPPISDATVPAAAVQRHSDGVLATALRLLITRVPDRVAVRVITAVCATLTMLGFMLFGALSNTEIGPYLEQIITVSIAVPVIVVMPFASVTIRLIREFEAERSRAMALAAIDVLTSLPNRRRLLELLERDLALARRMGRPLLIAVLDIDDFKSVNDVHGHRIGDVLLKAIATTCLRCARTTDVVGRWGGEEFVLVLPDTGPEGGAMLLERLRAAITTTVVRDGSGLPLVRTVSIGAIVLSATASKSLAPTVQDLLVDADRAMYRAKVGGKDRVEMEALGGAAPVDGSPETRHPAESA